MEPLTADNQQAVALWNLLGGYELQRLPWLSGIVRIDDWEATLERLRCIRDGLHEDVK